MTERVFLCLIVIGILCPAWLYSQENHFPTNIEMLEQAAGIAADSMALVPPQSGALDLKTTPGGVEGGWLVEGVLRNKLVAAGWSVSDASAKDSLLVSPAEFQLRIRLIEVGLLYPRTWRRHFFFGRQVERVGRVSFMYDLVDQTDSNVLASGTTRGEVTDVVPASVLPAVSDSKYAFASPALEKGQWDRFIEGALVLAIVGVLVYLFYSNKTA